MLALAIVLENDKANEMAWTFLLLPLTTYFVVRPFKAITAI